MCGCYPTQLTKPTTRQLQCAEEATKKPEAIASPPADADLTEMKLYTLIVLDDYAILKGKWNTLVTCVTDYQKKTHADQTPE
jgi:hypothetical protein